ncbi:MAG: site-specific integrase, partial [Methanosarcinales archaeon]|nr:site-specific integrase [Methanosarcinales archaeon]
MSKLQLSSHITAFIQKLRLVDGLSENTLVAYQRDLHNYQVWLFSNPSSASIPISLEEVNKSHLQDYLYSLFELEQSTR